MVGMNIVPDDTASPQEPRVVLLWFQDCPNHEAARVLLRELLTEVAPDTTIEDIDATEPAIAERHRFSRLADDPR